MIKMLKFLCTLQAIIFIQSTFASNYIQCNSSDGKKSFSITPMLKQNLLSPGKHQSKKDSFALIRMKDENGETKEQELNHYKVVERANLIKLEAKSKYQSNFIAERIWKEVFRRIPDFRVKIKSKDSSTAKGVISLNQFDKQGSYTRFKYRVSCNIFE